MRTLVKFRGSVRQLFGTIPGGPRGAVNNPTQLKHRKIVVEFWPPPQIYTVDWFNLMVFGLKNHYFIPAQIHFSRCKFFRASGEAILGTLKFS